MEFFGYIVKKTRKYLVVKRLKVTPAILLSILKPALKKRAILIWEFYNKCLNYRRKMDMPINNYIKKEGRALPVFILLDVSGSMSGQKIETVNVALKEMINSFKKIENPKGIIELCLLTFGAGKVNIVKELSQINDSDSYILTAGGDTPMGMAFEKVSEMIEDKSIVSSRAYTPTIVLISDGNPTDFDPTGKSIEEIMMWNALSKIHTGTRTSTATKLAMGIGDDVDTNILRAFINNNEVPVISAKDNNTISKFFEWVTMSISVRSISINPNQAQLEDTYMFDKDEIQF